MDFDYESKCLEIWISNKVEFIRIQINNVKVQTFDLSSSRKNIWKYKEKCVDYEKMCLEEVGHGSFCSLGCSATHHHYCNWQEISIFQNNEEALR